MARLLPMRVVALSCAALPLFMAPVSAQEMPIFTSCQYRFAVIFPAQPMMRDLTYTAGPTSAPAREFYLERNGNRYSVTVVDFARGPAVDDQIVERAAAQIRQRGEVRFQATAPYDPGMPGRQLNIFESNGRQHRASVYMADHRMFITEANATQGDFNALQFEQSITLIDANGDDLDRPNNGEVRNF